MSDGFSFKFSPEELKLRAAAGRKLIKKREPELRRTTDDVVIGTEYEFLKEHHLLWDRIFQKETDQIKDWSSGQSINVGIRVATLNAKERLRIPEGEIGYILPLDELGAEVTITAEGQDIPALDWPKRWYKLQQMYGIGAKEAKINLLMLTISVKK